MKYRRIALLLALQTAPALALAQRHRNPPQPPAVVPAVVAPPAVAQPVTPPADPLEAEHQQGIDLRRQRRDAEARDLFRALHERTHEVRVLAWLAGAEAALGEWVAAEIHLANALADAADPWVTQHRADLTSDLAGFRQHVGHLEVLSNTPGAELWVAGARTALPMAGPLTVPSGTVTVEVRAEGFLPETRTVSVTAGAGSLARETINLTPRPAVPADANPTPTVGQTPVRSEGRDGGLPVVRIVGVSLMGLGAVGLGLGIYGMVHYSSQRSDYEAAGCAAASPPVDCPSYDDGSGAFTLGIVSVSAGALLVAGGLTLLFIPLSSGRRADANRLMLGAGPSPLGVSLHGTF